jgi:hypothetical protein
VEILEQLGMTQEIPAVVVVLGQPERGDKAQQRGQTEELV